MRWLAKSTLILAIALMLPGSLELAQDGLHLVLEGHTSHDESHEHGNGDATEHGCSGPYHFCGCCTSATFVSVGNPAAPAAAGQVEFQSAERLDAPAPSSHIDEMLRPPAA